MKLNRLAFVLLLLGCERSTNAPPEVIGVFNVPASNTIEFEYGFDKPCMISFSTNMSWKEMERMESLPGAGDPGDNRNIVLLYRESDGVSVGSLFGGGRQFEPDPSGKSLFRIRNASREDLEITVTGEMQRAQQVTDAER